MKYKIVPHFWVDDLEKELCENFGDDFMEIVGDLRMFLFDDRYMNDVSVEFNIKDLDDFYEESDIRTVVRINARNSIKLFLQEMFPGYEYVLIDVMW